MGRKSKLTPDTEKRLLDLIRAGVAQKRAAQACGLAAATFYGWMEDKPDFRTAVEKAYAECVSAKVLKLRKYEDDSWQAVAWWLERREREDYGRVERVEQTGKDGGPVQHEISGKIDIKSLSDEQLNTLRAALGSAPRLGSALPGSRNGSREKEPA